MIGIAAIAMGVVFAVCGYRWGFYTIWAVFFNFLISIYIGVMLSPTVAGFMPTLFPAGAGQSDGNFWYMYAAIVAGVALASFIILQITAMAYFTGTFNITLPKLMENLGAMFIGFVAGYILWGFICFLVLIMPVSKDPPLLLKSFTADQQSKELSMPTISKVANTINALSLQPNRPQVQNVIKWTLGWENTESQLKRAEITDSNGLTKPLVSPHVAAPAKQITGDSGANNSLDLDIQSYIVSFTTASEVNAITARELLTMFSAKQPPKIETHHYKTELRKNALVGLICVDGKSALDATVQMLRSSNDLKLVSFEPATEDSLRKLDAMGQPSLTTKPPVLSVPAAPTAENRGTVTPSKNSIVLIDINDPGIGGDHEGFNGQMSKYETTNAQYCEFLNAAKATNQITVYDNKIYATSDTGHSQLYYDLTGVGDTFYRAYLGGAARIHYRDSSFTVDHGFGNHPVTYISWYGATAFCNYYGYRLPTEWEWQAVADYDGTYWNGSGSQLTNSIANYIGSKHPYGTTAVGAFGTYGYGVCDMAGNAFEWTSSFHRGDRGECRVIRGGSWGCADSRCAVSYRDFESPHETNPYVGFRVCR